MAKSDTDYIPKIVRSATLVTTSFVAGSIVDGEPEDGKGVDARGAHRFNQLMTYLTFTKASSTTAVIKFEFSRKLLFALPYDGQSSNFTVGKTITGGVSGATAVIIADTDGGATGTLIIGSIRGIFIDNETITDDNGTPGVAKSNGGLNHKTAAPDDASFTGIYGAQESQETIATGDATLREMVHTITSANQAAATHAYRIPTPIKDKYVRISVKVTGTATSTSMAIVSVLGNTA